MPDILTQFAAELRKWWKFDSHQRHIGGWHEREAFIEQKLPELLRADNNENVAAEIGKALVLAQSELPQGWYIRIEIDPEVDGEPAVYLYEGRKGRDFGDHGSLAEEITAAIEYAKKNH